MQSAHIVVETPVVQTARTMQLSGMFDLPTAKTSRCEWNAAFPLDEKPLWNVGLIVGPSGCGKSTIARHFFADCLGGDYVWPDDRSLVDGFPASMGIKEIVALLSSVGFSSPPAWLRPYQVLSNGEKFRASVARALACAGDKPCVFDEFTSVVDRTVAQIGSAAVAKAVRARGQKFIAVSCHYDILEWLQPDWVYEPATNSFAWRLLRRRPEIALKIVRVHRDAWNVFRHHHYLDHTISPAAKCFVGLINGLPAAFTGVLPFPHAVRPGWRESRTVCLPDFQGVGIGNAMAEYVASLFVASGRPYFSATSHPAMIGHRNKSPLWRMSRGPSMVAKQGRSSTTTGMKKTESRGRLTAGFEYVGQARREQATHFGLVVR